jgi:hypothetical protein
MFERRKILRNIKWQRFIYHSCKAVNSSKHKHCNSDPFSENPPHLCIWTLPTELILSFLSAWERFFNEDDGYCKLVLSKYTSQ